MKNFQSEEDYLERILMLKKANGHVRSIDIANDMNYSKPSVSIAMKKLKEKELISIDNDGFISLTNKGLDIANHVLEKHTIISSILINLGVDSETALEDACKIEHDLSDKAFEKIKEYYYKTK